MSEEWMAKLLRVVAFVILTAASISGVVYPCLYYTRNESVQRLWQQEQMAHAQDNQAAGNIIAGIRQYSLQSQNTQLQQLLAQMGVPMQAQGEAK